MIGNRFKLLEKLRVAVVEDHHYAINILIEMLRKAGIKKIEKFRNARSLIGNGDVGQFDVIVIGFDLSDTLDGEQCIKVLAEAKKLKGDATVIFATRYPEELDFDAMVDFYPIEVVEKPYSAKNINQALSRLTSKKCLLEPVIPLIRKKKFAKALKTWETVSEKLLNKDVKEFYNEVSGVMLLNAHKMEQLAEHCQQHTEHEWSHWLDIERLYLEQDYVKAQTLLIDMMKKPQFRERAALWLAKVFVLMGRNDDALKAICKMRDTTLTVPEMRLKAYLMQLVEGEHCCYEYLNKRKRHAFEYKEIQIEIILSICRLLLLEAQQTNNREVAAANIKEIEYQLHMVASTNKKISNSMQFEAIQLATDYLKTTTVDLDMKDRVMHMYGGIMKGQFSFTDVVTMGILVAILDKGSMKKEADALLFYAEDKLYNMPESAERVLSILVFYRLTGMIYAPKTLAKMYNRAGLKAFESGDIQGAIRRFNRCMEYLPTDIPYKLNMVTALLEHDLLSYRGKSVEELLEDARDLILREQASDAVKKRFSQLNNRAKARSKAS